MIFKETWLNTDLKRSTTLITLITSLLFFSELKRRASTISVQDLVDDSSDEEPSEDITDTSPTGEGDEENRASTSSTNRDMSSVTNVRFHLSKRKKI